MLKPVSTAKTIASLVSSCLAGVTIYYLMDQLRDLDRGQESVEPLNGQPESCRVHLIAAGTYSHYNPSNVPHWIAMTDDQCTIQIYRPETPDLHIYLSEKERRALEFMRPKPVVQADFMKFLLVYHLGGVVADFDVQPLQAYPKAWTETPALSKCDVFLGQEHTCYEDDCLQTVSRAEQLQTWTLWARQSGSLFLRSFIDKVITKLDPESITTTYEQEISGSGILSDFIREEILKADYMTKPLDGTDSDLRTTPGGVFRFAFQTEQVCILGFHWTGGSCGETIETCLLRHSFEGSWKQ